jgi:hypothetical protein
MPREKFRFLKFVVIRGVSPIRENETGYEIIPSKKNLAATR